MIQVITRKKHIIFVSSANVRKDSFFEQLGKSFI